MRSELQELLEIRAGLSLRGAIRPVQRGEEGLRLLRMRDVDSVLGIDDSNLISIKAQGKSKPDYLLKGDILFVGRGFKFFAVCVEKPLDNVVASPHFLILRTKDNSILPEYVSWYINHKRAQSYLRKRAVGSDVMHVSNASLMKLPIEVPPLQDQRLIVKVNNLVKEETKTTNNLLLKKKQIVKQLLDNKIGSNQ